MMGALTRKYFLVILILFTNYCLTGIKCEEADNFESEEYQSMDIVSTDHITRECIQICPEENKTRSENLLAGCEMDCYVRQCSLGCSSWELALESSCQFVCNKTNEELLEPKELYCVMGCNDALNRYFKWLRAEVGTPPAPTLIANSLTATSLTLKWEIPPKLFELTRGKSYSPKSFLVQWRFEEVVAVWKFCQNQSRGENSTAKVDNLQPYTKYRFRIALPLSPNFDEVLVSEQSEVIATLAKGAPISEPGIVRAVAIDHTKISVSWEPGPITNGPIVSYVLQIRALSSDSYSATKDKRVNALWLVQWMCRPRRNSTLQKRSLATTLTKYCCDFSFYYDKTVSILNLEDDGQDIPVYKKINFYMFDKLMPSRNYSISVSMKNSEGEGPPAEMFITTPPPPPLKDDEPKPKLILGTDYTVLSKDTDDISTPPEAFYRSDDRILGITVHIGKQLLFVADQGGFVNKAPLERIGKKESILSPKSGLNLFPSLLSLDWLNDQLYILGEIRHRNSKHAWQISRCGLNGRGLTTAITGLLKKPSHIQVDPFNGYLFWVITGYGTDTGLFRLDLADVAKNIDQQINPVHIIQEDNVGAFVVDYTNFRVLLPRQQENTMVSVALDGKDRIDIRRNTDSPKLNLVKSLAMANEIFYWTNGSDLFVEEYSKDEDIYYHNSYHAPQNTSFIAVCVNHASIQPTPIPINPPQSIQALLSQRKAKIAWSSPLLLGNQGKGAWKDWNYELEISDGTSVSNVIRNIKGTFFIVEKLKPNTSYTFRGAAYTSAGKGPWSTEFSAKTLKSSHDRYLIWSSKDGLLQSDVIGEHIHTLIPPSDVGAVDISDIAWFDDMLYYVSNSTIRYYNRTSGFVGQFENVHSVASIDIDWIGKRIYWSDPKRQWITRSNLNGEDGETLPLLLSAIELKVDSLNGHLYFSTGYAVEVCRLNGKNRLTYFSVPLYSGKRIVGITLDIEQEYIYWLVWSYRGTSLFSAPMARNWNKSIMPQEYMLQDKMLTGHLTFFSDRLLWFQYDNTVVVADMQGRNTAFIQDPKLIGLKSITVIDPTNHVYPNITKELNVIPEQIPGSSIKVNGTWKSFNISWDPVKTVTYGEVFYELRVTSLISNDVIKGTTVPYFYYTSHKLPPYTNLHIKLKAFTYWGSSKVTSVYLNSPSAAPSAPIKPRIFITHYHNPFKIGVNITATFRWGYPSKPNGQIVGYKIYCWYNEMNGQKQEVCKDLKDINQNIVISDLKQNTTYYFQVQALSPVQEGQRTDIIEINTNLENPVPKVVVANLDKIIEVDLDLNTTKILTQARIPITHMVYIKQENRILWINENRELISFNGTKTKLTFITNKVLSLTVDWIMRIVYWSQMDTEDDSSIYRFDLNRFNGKSMQGKKIISRAYIIKNLIIYPINQTLFWLAYQNQTSISGNVIQYDLKLHKELNFMNTTKCFNGNYRTILRDTISNDSDRLILGGNCKDIYMHEFSDDTCYLLKIPYDDSIQQIAKDGGHMYLIKNQKILAYNQKQYKKYELNLTQVQTLFVYNHQNYPPKRCLIPKDNNSSIYYIPELVNKTENSLFIQLPYIESNPNCSIKVPGIKYSITVTPAKKNNLSLCRYSECQSIISYDTLAQIKNLKSFTKYWIKISINNYYGEEMGIKPINGLDVIFSTAPGYPTPPRNVTVDPVSPTGVFVDWYAPYELNCESIWYIVHWETENTKKGVVNRQQRTVYPQDNLLPDSSDYTVIYLSRLLPSHKYSLWVQAYSTNKTFSTSKIVEFETLPKPDNITLVTTTPYSLKLHWKNHLNISRYYLECAQLASEQYEPIFNSMEDQRSEIQKEYFIIENLEPKTIYKFRLRLYYAIQHNVSYIWPSDNRYAFETLGDRPSSPGSPTIQYVSGDVFQATWDPAKANGFTIEEYNLEAMKSRLPRRLSRSVTDDDDTPAVSAYEPDPPSNYTVYYKQQPWVEEPEAIEDIWELKCNGTETHCIMNDVNPINRYSFRVKARNAYGWGPYSEVSEPIMEEYISTETRNELIVAIFAPVTVVLSCFLLAACMMCVLQRRSAAKKVLHQANKKISDGELIQLQELPHIHKLTHTTNILYTFSPLTDADIALLPQIKKEQITMAKFLGRGAFGEVYEGTIKNTEDGDESSVAIKTLRKGATDQDKQEFLKEAQLMSNFKHKHILKLIGVCFDTDSLFIIMELMEGGDLLSYLRRSRPTLESLSPLTLYDLLTMCLDVASGCRYLEEMHFVHRDLACRNCLVSSAESNNRVVKIGDFGLARDIYRNDYYRKEGEGLLPVRWMSPESLVDGVFTSQSDIWAFGILCWEIMTLGQQPYPARTNVEVLHYVRDGGRPGRPPGCPAELYQLLLKCWNYRPEERPTFKYCLETLKTLRTTIYSAVKITAAKNPKKENGGVFNPSYSRIANKYTKLEGQLKFTTDIKTNGFVEPIITTPRSSANSAIVPKYLELLYNHDEETSANRTSSNGYESPISNQSIDISESTDCSSGVIVNNKDQVCTYSKIMTKVPEVQASTVNNKENIINCLKEDTKISTESKNRKAALKVTFETETKSTPLNSIENAENVEDDDLEMVI